MSNSDTEVNQDVAESSPEKEAPETPKAPEVKEESKPKSTKAKAPKKATVSESKPVGPKITKLKNGLVLAEYQE